MEEAVTHIEDYADENVSERLYADACNQFADVEDNVNLVKDAFYEAHEQAFRSGEITVVSPERLVADRDWVRENGRAGRRLSPVLADMRSGQMPFSDVVIALHLGVGIGQNRKTTLAAMTPDDVQIALQSRRDNARKINDALARDEENFTWAADLIVKYGGMTAAWEAGAIDYTEEKTA